MLKVIWRRLSSEVKKEVFDELFPLEDEIRTDVAERLAKVLSFRPVHVRRMDESTFERNTRTYFNQLGRAGIECLVHYHLKARSDLLLAFYDEIGVTHDGLDVPESEQNKELPEDVAIQAAMAMINTYTIDEVWFLLAVMSQRGYPGWLKASASGEKHLRMIIDSQDGEIKNEDPQSMGDDSDQDEPEPNSDIQASLAQLATPSFTTLDQLLIRAMVSTLNEVEGSLVPDQLDDLVSELTDLNDSRHQSHFHRGFCDSLLNRSIAAWKSGANKSRRAWYLVGHLLGTLRKVGESDLFDLIRDLPGRDKNLLFDSTEISPRMLAPIAIRSALENSQPSAARKWLVSHGVATMPRCIGHILEYSDSFLSEGKHLAEITELLALAESQFVDRGSKGDAPPPPILRRVKELRARALRLGGHHVSAIAILDQLLAEDKEDGPHQRWLAQKALASMGLRTLNQFGAEEKGDKRDARLQEIKRNTELFEEASKGSNPSPTAIFALALQLLLEPHEGNGPENEARDLLRTAIATMIHDGNPIWESSGLLDRARFYLTLAELRLLDASLAEAATDRLKVSLQNDVSFPTDFVLEAVNLAVLLNAPGVSSLAEMGLKKYQNRAIHALDMEQLVTRSAQFSAALMHHLTSMKKRLKANELWGGWFAVLVGSISSTPRRLEDCETAIDQLEMLSEKANCTKQFIELLENPEELWDPVWCKEERDIAYLKTLLIMGNNEKALTTLRTLTHAAITAYDFDSAEGFIAELERCGESPEALANFKIRMHALRPAPSNKLPKERGPVNILWVGGNEQHSKYEDCLRDELVAIYPNVKIEFIFSAWSSNWDKHYDNVKPRISAFDGIVLSRYIRTHLGRNLRELAGTNEVPWRCCTGTGFNSMLLTLEAAINAANI